MDRVGFEEAGFFLVPLIRFDGDLVSEEKPWFCGASAFAAVNMAGWF